MKMLENDDKKVSLSPGSNLRPLDVNFHDRCLRFRDGGSQSTIYSCDTCAVTFISIFEKNCDL